MLWLKQSTAVTVKIGPFLDEDDGKTAEDGLTIAQADVRLSKNGANIAQKTESSSCTHDELGIYDCPLDTTDTATLGRLQLWVHESGALPVWHEFMVVPANVWDSFFGADYLQVDALQVEGSDATDQITAAVPTAAAIRAEIDSNSTQLAAIVADTDELQTDDVPTLIAALPTAAAIRAEMDSNSTQLAAIVADTDELQTDDVPGLIAALNDPAAADVADAVWDETLADHLGAGSTGNALNAAGAAGDPWSTAIPGAYGAGTAGKIVGDNVNAPLATIDTVVDAIKAVTDALPDAGALSDLATILADTNELQTDDVPGLIAALNDPTAATIADAVWDEAIAGHTGSGSTGEALDNATAPTAAAIRAEIDSNSTQLAAIVADTDELQTDWADGGRLDLLLDTASAGAGAGAITFTYTLTSSVDSAPIADAQVWVTTDLSGTNVIASGTTDANGEVVFYLDAGTVYVWRQKSGWNFTNPDTETVS